MVILRITSQTEKAEPLAIGHEIAGAELPMAAWLTSTCPMSLLTTSPTVATM